MHTFQCLWVADKYQVVEIFGVISFDCITILKKTDLARGPVHFCLVKTILIGVWHQYSTVFLYVKSFFLLCGSCRVGNIIFWTNGIVNSCRDILDDLRDAVLAEILIT